MEMLGDVLYENLYYVLHNLIRRRFNHIVDDHCVSWHRHE